MAHLGLAHTAAAGNRSSTCAVAAAAATGAATPSTAPPTTSPTRTATATPPLRCREGGGAAVAAGRA
eukprot:scaffold15784_cov60-Phaeocystis_antarctica.AAC.1